MQIEREASDSGSDIRIFVDGYPLITVWGLYDAHVDNIAHADKRLAEDIERIKNDEYARVVVGGDFNDMLFVRDPRFVSSQLSPWLRGKDDIVAAVVDYNVSILSPIADKIDAYISGNHEEEFTIRHGANVCEQTAKRLGVPFYPDDCYVRYYFRDAGGKGCTSIGHIYHGTGVDAPVTKGTIGLERTRAGWRADWVMSGHIHRKTLVEQPQVEPRGAFGKCRLYEVPWCGAVCGTYLRAYVPGVPTFSRRKHMNPYPLGAGKLYLQVERARHGGGEGELQATPMLQPR